MSRRTSALALAVALVTCLQTGTLSASEAWRDKVDPWVLATAQRGSTEFLVVLAEQADLRQVQAVPQRAARVSFVVDRLTEVARRSQAGVLAELAARGAEHRALWVANMVWVSGDLALVEAMARRGDVARVSANPWVPLRLPGTPLAGDGEAPEAVGSNVTQINADDVWALGYTGQGIVVAGQDTGYNWDHPALVGHYRGWNGIVADHNYNWHDAIHSGGGVCGANSTQPCDDDQHGTHTMGTMVGDDGGTNQIGVAPGAKWIGCRNMDQGNGTPTTYSECFQWFLAPTNLAGTNPDPSRAPHVINNSWGCPPSEGCTDPNVLKTVVENVRAAGIVVVVSAGNAGSACSSVDDPPGIYNASFSVGAVDSSDAIASFSSRGPVTVDGSNRLKPDISAPGVNIRSSIPGGSYAQYGWSGTSMAGPHVAGATALLLSAWPAWQGNVSLVESRLTDTALARTSTQTCGGVPGSQIPNNTFGYGRVDALAAVSMADLAVTLADAPDPVALGADLTYTINVSNAGPVPATGVTVSQALPAGAAFVSASAGCSHAAGTVTCTVGSLARAASASRTVVARPASAGTATSVATVSGSLLDPDANDNQASASTEVTGDAAADLSLAVGGSPDPVLVGAELTWTLTVSNFGPSASSSVVVTDVLPAAVEFVAASPACSHAAGTVTCTLGAVGASSSAQVTVTARPLAVGAIDTAPSVAAATSDPDAANNSANDQVTAVALEPAGLLVDAAGNSVLEPDESVTVAPSWRNPSAGAATVVGAGLLSGPGGATYSLLDPSAAYGTVVAGGTASCGAGDGCYTVLLTPTSGRPALHWDAQLDETLTPGGGGSWTLHVGASFSDVPPSYLLYRHVETILHAGVTVGYANGTYVPSGTVPRSQMAMFLARAMAGSDAAVPASGSVPGKGPYSCGQGGASVFADVAPTDSFCRHVHHVAARDVTEGCGDGTVFCPATMVPRSQMAMFVARAMAGGDASVPAAYSDGDTGRSYDCGTPAGVAFTDVAASDGFCRHAHYLWARGVVDGCAASPARYCPASLVLRGQMAKFLTNGFGLQLY